ncbi:MAG: DUF4838 domain-containing protein [Clostridia bacterium]|nr:DUF4838 domain-containing protein [Clostridia bacterium]
MKKRSFLKIFSTALATALAFGICATGCKKDEESETSQTDERVEPTHAEFSGTHVYTAPDTDKDFIKNGVCDYTVVVPEVASNYIRTAQSELCYFFKKATGIDLRVINDGQLTTKTHSDDTKYISIGETTLLKSTDIDYSWEKLNYDGGRIVTKGNNIYIAGGYDSGTMFAVYTFLRLTFNYECYTSSTFVIDEGVKDMKLKAYDVTDIPDFRGRSRGLATANTVTAWDTYDETNFIYRMGYLNTYNQSAGRMHAVIDDPNNPGQMTIDPDKAGVSTNTDIILNKENLSATHPSWFSTEGVQWCYTARGNQAEFEKMTDAVAMSVIYGLTNYTKETDPIRHSYSITQADNGDFCGCSTCAQMKGTYGTHAGAVIRFLNVVSDKVMAWMNKPENEPYYREDFQLEFFAYGPTMNAPVKASDDGFEPVDESVVLRENIAVYHANIGGDYQSSIYAEENDFVRETIEGWQAITDSFHWFLYNTNRRAFQYLYDSFDHYTSEGFQYYASVSNEHMYVESQTNNAMPSAWHNLKFYLISRLSWDCTLDENQLMDDYFKAVFGPGAKAMREFFDAERLYCEIEFAEKQMSSKRSIYNYVHLQCDWPVNVVDSWIEKTNQAIEAVGVYEFADPEKYDMYWRNIEIEAISPLYIMLDQNMNSLSTPQKDKYVSRLKADCARWNFSRMIVVHVAYGTPTMLPEFVDGL